MGVKTPSSIVSLRRLAVRGIRLYQKGVSPFFLPKCRYLPTCSDYACQSLMKHGFIKGGWLSVKRILRCHPWAKARVDPVPSAFEKNLEQQALERPSDTQTSLTPLKHES